MCQNACTTRLAFQRDHPRQWDLSRQGTAEAGGQYMNRRCQETLGYEIEARTVARLAAQRSDVATFHPRGGAYQKTESRQMWSLELTYEHDLYVRHSRTWAAQT